MTINWQVRPPLSTTAPYDGELVIVAAPNFVCASYGGNLEPDTPYYLYFARWDRDDGCWLTTEADEETGGPVRLPIEKVAFWSEANFPMEPPPAP